MPNSVAGGTVAIGTTSFSWDFYIIDTSVTTGVGKTGLVFNTAGLSAYYHRTGTASTAITLATLAAATTAWSSGGFKEIDATNMPGLYRLDVPDAAFAAGVDSVTVHIKGTAIVCFPVVFALAAPPEIYGTFATGTLSVNTCTTSLSAYADGRLENKVLFVHTGTCAGFSTRVSKFLSSGGQMYFSEPLPAAPANGDIFTLR